MGLLGISSAEVERSVFLSYATIHRYLERVDKETEDPVGFGHSSDNTVESGAHHSQTKPGGRFVRDVKV